MAKLPAFQFYPGDWLKDPNLRRCSQAARGVWIDMLCYMFECEQRGVLVTGSCPWTRDDVAAAVGGNADVTLRCISELISKGVCSVREDGALYSRRLTREEEVRKQGRQRVAKHRGKPPSNADVTPMKHPSSSSSSSTECVTHVTGDDESTLPTVAEIIAYGTGMPGIPRDYCEHYHERRSIGRSWYNRGRLIDWKRDIVSRQWWGKDRDSWGKVINGHQPKPQPRCTV